jgi:hypothetical protein
MNQVNPAAGAGAARGTAGRVRLVNPRGQLDAVRASLASRLVCLDGRRIGFIDNIKPNAGLFLDHVERMMVADHPGISTVRVRKNFTSSRLIADQLEGRADAVVNAWGD